jgi:Tol biopolymer transport system component
VISPDGQRAVFRTLPETGGQELWMLDLRTGISSRFTVGGAQHPVWKRDGTQVAYFVPRGGDAVPGIYTRAADLSGAPQLVHANTQLWPTSWTADGRIVFSRFSTEQASDIGIVGPGDSVPQWLVRTDAAESHAVVSPDGQWLAYTSDNTVMVQPMSGTGAAVQISAGSAYGARWSRDGRVLYYVSLPEKSLVAATLAPGSGVVVTGRSTVSEQTATLVQNGGVNWDLFPDGKRILFASTGATDAPVRLVVVEDWRALVRAAAQKP